MCHTLVLSRHKDEKIILDLRSFGLGLVEIVQTDIRGDKSRIGIQADPRIPVHRFEVFEAIQRAGAGAFTPSHAKHAITDAPVSDIRQFAIDNARAQAAALSDAAADYQRQKGG